MGNPPVTSDTNTNGYSEDDRAPAVVGEDGVDQVFLARDHQAEKSNPFGALKVLGASFRDHPQVFAALRCVAAQSRTLTQPEIFAVCDFDRSGDHVHMDTELVKGEALDVLIGSGPDGGKLAEVWWLIEAASRGLQYEHQKKIVHADVKPRNVLVTENGEVKVLDLRVGRIVDGSQASSGMTRFDPDSIGALTLQCASQQC